MKVNLQFCFFKNCFKKVELDDLPFVDKLPSARDSKWSPAEALLWVQLCIGGDFGQCIDSVHDIIRWRQKCATKAQQPYTVEWRKIKKELQIEYDEVDLLVKQASQCTVDEWDDFNNQLDLQTG